MSTEKKQIPAVEGLFRWEDEEPRLIGGKCPNCDSLFFPQHHQMHKPECGKGGSEEVLLSRKGTLKSYTVHHYAPPPPFIKPDPFVPFAIGLVSLPEGIDVVGMLTGVDIGALKTHIDVELVTEKITEDQDGNEIVTWKFRPV